MSTKKKSQAEVGGLVGEELTVRKLKHRMVVKNRPKMVQGEPTDKQEAANQKFLEAAQYAKQVTADAQSSSDYKKGITPQKPSVHLVAMTDYLTPPKVREIDPAGYNGIVGNIILVRATDDFMVAGVKIVIRDSDGNVLEEGNASPDEKVNYWKYVATVAIPSVKGITIQATAFDRPGNKGTAERVL